MDEYTQMGETRPIEVKYLRAGVEETATINPTVMMYNIYVSGKFTAQGIEIVDLDERDTKGMADIEALAVGDVITEINGVSYLSLPAMYRELTEFSGIDPNEKITMKVIRGGEIKEIQVRPLSKAIMERIAAGEPIVDVNMGINPSYKFNLVKSLAYSGKQTVRSVTAIYDSFYLLFKDKSVTVKAFSGPVGIAVIIGSVVRQGFVSILVLMGLLSVNVGLFNLLPIPALDGGRLVFLGYEAITGKKPNQKVETALITITMLLLIGFMIFVTFNDIIGQF
jgi:regulator of sigma E protease